MAGRTVLIVTLPRSGSSLLAGVLHRLGVPMGSEDDLRMGTHLNRLGCHEDQEFQRISLNILLEAGLLLDLRRRLSIDEARLRSVVQRYEHEIRRYASRNPGKIWGFKDPGLLYALPHLYSWFQSPRVIHLHRNVRDTARSLHATFKPRLWLPEMREKLPLFTPLNRARLVLEAARLLLARSGELSNPRFFEEVVRRGHDRIESFTRQNGCLRISLEDLVADPRRCIRRVCRHVEIEPDGRHIDRAVRFVHPEMLHGSQGRRPRR